MPRKKVPERLRNLLALCVSAANPYVLAVSAIVGIVEAVIFLVSDAREICRASGMPFLKARTRFNTFNDQLNTTKKIHQLICANTVENLNLKSYQESLRLIHADFKEKKKFTDIKTKPTTLSKGLKTIGQVISGAVAVGSGFFLAQCALGICAAAVLTNPIGWIICGFSALLSLSAFYFFRKRSVSKTVDKIMGQPSKFKADLNNFITEDVEKINSKMTLMVSSKQSRELEVKRLNSQIESMKMENKIHNKITFNTYNFSHRFFHLKKFLKNKSKSNLKNVIHRTRLA